MSGEVGWMGAGEIEVKQTLRKLSHHHFFRLAIKIPVLAVYPRR
jgi:hypothetical protein